MPVSRPVISIYDWMGALWRMGWRLAGVMCYTMCSACNGFAVEFVSIWRSYHVEKTQRLIKGTRSDYTFIEMQQRDFVSSVCGGQWSKMFELLHHTNSFILMHVGLWIKWSSLVLAVRIWLQHAKDNGLTKSTSYDFRFIFSFLTVSNLPPFNILPYCPLLRTKNPVKSWFYTSSWRHLESEDILEPKGIWYCSLLKTTALVICQKNLLNV